MGFEFAGFVLDPQSFRLLRHGEEVPLERRAFDLLSYLIQHHDRVVAKDELLEQVWGARALSEGALSNAIAKLRRALDQGAHEKRPIETVHGRGYRFHLPAEAGPAAHAEAGRTGDRFVGRESMLRALLLRLDAAAEERPKLVLITGEAGIGKTRLARELAVRAVERGFSAWRGGAYDARSAPPYWAFTEVLRAARDALGPEAFLAALPAQPWALAQLSPEFAPPEPPSPSDREPQVARFRLFDEIARFLRAAAQRQPLLVVLDDLHDADLGTIEVLAFCAQTLAREPIVFLATSRTVELPRETHAAQAAYARLARLATVIELMGLNAEEVRELLTDLLRGRDVEHALEARDAEALCARTGGNPLFVREAIDALLRSGNGALSLHSSALPSAVRELFARRIGALPEGTQRVLEAGALASASFSAPLLAEVLELPLAEVLDAVDAALRDKLVTRAEAEDTFQLAHALVRECLQAQLGLRARGALHARFADALARRDAGSSSALLSEIAHHALQAAPFAIERVVDACRRAAAAAQEVFGFDGAAALLARAVRKVEQAGGDVQTRCTLLSELGEQHFYAGEIESAVSAFVQAAECARAGERPDLLALVAPRLVDCHELGAGEHAYTRAVVEQALADASTQAPARRATLLAQRAELAYDLPLATRLALLDEAAQLAERADAEGALLEVAHSRAILRCPAGLVESERAAREFLRLLERHPAAATSMRYRSLRRFGAHLSLYLAALTRGAMIEAQAEREACAAIAASSHVAAARFAVALMRAGAALAEGRADALRTLVGELGSTIHGTSSKLACVAYQAALGELEGKLDEAAAKEVALLLTSPPSADIHGTYVLVTRARGALWLGDVSRARVLLAQLPISELQPMPARYGDLGLLSSLAEVYVALDERERAARLYTQLSPYGECNAVGPSFEYRGSMRLFLGVLALALGEQQTAASHLDAAQAQNLAWGVAPPRLLPAVQALLAHLRANAQLP